MLHVHCGDCSADALRASGTPGQVIVWSELLWSGPLSCDTAADRSLIERSKHLSAATGGERTPEQCREKLRRQDRGLKTAGEHDETVLWLDACMYDQLILARLLWWLGKHVPAARLSLICIGEHEAVPRFCGLGELTPAQLADLLPARRPVSAAQCLAAARAWEALCKPDPLAVEALAREDTSVLPFLRDALVRFLEELPGTHCGLSRLQREVLRVVQAGCSGPLAVFAAVSDLEERPFFGDTSLWQCVNGLSAGPSPALGLDGPGPLPLWGDAELGQWRVSLTELGCSLLAREADYIERNGIDRWLGGTHLQDPRTAWRWDPTARRVLAGRDLRPPPPQA